jgi:serine/threonine protein kinase
MLHGSGLVHRDIKPDNLLIETNGQIRLIDYGLVGSYDPEADPDARRGYLAGSFWYMAPESICSQSYPPACDIYALGCVLLELVADPSRLPEPQLGMSLGETVGDIDRVIPVDTPEELRELIRDMLDSNSENRPLAASVARIGSGQSVSRVDNQIAFQPTDLLGRDPEMQAAEKWFHDVARYGTGWLHLCGANGCGKSWFASELRKRVSSNRWFQVFDASCLTTPRKGFCTFDEIVDIVARRYARDDRGLIELSPTAANSMLWLFPALRSIVDPKHRVSDVDPCRILPTDRFATSESSADVLTGMTELFNRLCEYGPVMLVIDNFQWIDRSSVDLLNRLLSEVNGSLGLVTISRNESTPLHCKPDKTISLNPLDERQSVRLVENMIGFGVPRISPRLVKMVARSGRGNASDLCQMLVELASEMNDKKFDASYEPVAAGVRLESSSMDSGVSRLVTVAQIGKRICVSILERLVRSISFGR